MRKKEWGRMLALAMAASVTATGIPFSVHAEENENVPNETESGDGYNLVWQDEFDGDSLNTADWNVEQHEPGWVNSELQRYTALDEGNIEVRDGALHILPKYIAADAQEGEESLEVLQAEPQHITADVNYSGAETDVDNALIQVNFGLIGDVDEEAAKAAAEVVLSNLSFTDNETGENLLSNDEVSSGQPAKEWNFSIGGQASASMEKLGDKYVVRIENSGTENWHVQLTLNGVKLTAGHSYTFAMDAISDVNRAVEIGILDTTWNWYGGSKAVIAGSGKVSGGSSQGASGDQYTSGRITTQGKHDFTYGRFEARAKVPTGKGFLPAFWLMASDEGLYGQWPKCGEIDIMEVMGQATNKSYHTIHYGYSSGSGHKENQGSKVLEGSSFADDYHVFRADWEPGKITWYVDDEQVYETSDWYTGTDDANQLTYPAPFDQDFYIILNLAIGGSWVGYPGAEDLDNINSQEYAIDYVRVYQKDESEYTKGENEAKRPEKAPVSYREADGEGNYVVNGNFDNDLSAEGEATDNWVLHLESDAAGSTAGVKDNAVTIIPSAIGGQNHSVQLKQAGIPVYKGWEYELSFDAASTEERDIVVDVEGPDHGWTRYMNDTICRIGTQEEHYSLNFTMNEKTDANSALEFNLGKQNSTAPVTIKNVKLVHVSGEEIKDENTKEIRPDGNYVYNGSFDQGEKRLGYWEYDEDDAASISVTNVKNKRELMVKVEVPEGASEANPVAISQSDLAPLNKGQYEISFSAYHKGGEADGLTVKVVGDEYTPSLTGEKQSFSKVINVDKNLEREESNVEFSFTKPGTYYLDDVFLAESALLKNGSFDAGLAGFSPYVYDSVSAKYVIDNMNGNDNTFAITIDDTVADDASNEWYVQLNQDGLTIEEGKYYYVAFRAKSSIERKIKYCLQEFEGAWANYSGTGEVEIGNEWQKFSHAFQMTNKTDTKTRFNITMGSVGGERITKQHDIFIDDIELIEITKEQYDKINSGEIEDPTTDPAKDPSTEPAEEPGTEPSGSTDEPSTEDPKETPAENPSDEPAQNPEGGSGNTDEPSETPSQTPSSNAGTDSQTPAQNTGTQVPGPVVTPSQNNTGTQTGSSNTAPGSGALSPEQNPILIEKVDPKMRFGPVLIETNINNNGKAEKGEIKATENNVYEIIGKKSASFRMNYMGYLKKTYSIPTSVVVDGTKVKVTKVAEGAFSNNKTLKNVTLGKNITTISKEAFSGCDNLKKITVKGNKLKKIYKSAFKGCKLNKDFKVIIHAKSDKEYEKIVKLFKKAGLKNVTFVRK
ncbi:carbohydrate binding domain-containing protein [Butyrivibrio sp. LC3010]|uniref:carbohydrate binding domain-containing protein n=1 Tax=Butyrivibrio sp. LC3010 TaxID=1280680 RepID=UPI00041CEA1B|nr:carbohydrate binding domain-containing protein [Butyrivibrio sp. LC3010]